MRWITRGLLLVSLLGAASASLADEPDIFGKDVKWTFYTAMLDANGAGPMRAGWCAGSFSPAKDITKGPGPTEMSIPQCSGMIMPLPKEYYLAAFETNAKLDNLSQKLDVLTAKLSEFVEFNRQEISSMRTTVDKVILPTITKFPSPDLQSSILLAIEPRVDEKIDARKAEFSALLAEETARLRSDLKKEIIANLCTEGAITVQTICLENR
jgi:hypothetical protein